MKKILDILFCGAFVLLLLLPLTLTNFKKNQSSELDNSYLPEIDWSASVPIRERIGQMEEYLNMRIGFREPALDLYVRLNDRLFGLMDHPIYMYGKEGYVFQATDNYLADYQHLNLDPEWTEHFVGWLQQFSDMAHASGAEFWYTLIPDKKTVYSEYFPDGYNVYGTVSRTDQLLEALSRTDVDWFYALDTLKEAKQHSQVANVKYDAGHWNDNGAFVTVQAVLELLRQRHPEIPPLERSEFTITTAHKDSLQTSHFPIDEDVPLYTRRHTESEEHPEWLRQTLRFPEKESYRTHYVNPSHPELPKLLVIHDSYLINKECFFLDHFSEVTFIHRYNLKGPHIFEEYLELVDPDVVIYENPERSLPIRFDPEQ